MLNRNFISRDCSFYLLSNHSLDFLHYQTLSGLGYNKLGLYNDCIEDQNNQFYLVNAVSDFFGTRKTSPIQFMSGICFNRRCSASDLLYASSALETYIKQPPFQIINVIQPSLVEQHFDFITVFTIVFISLLLLLFVIFSIIHSFNREKQNKAETKCIQIFSVFTTFRMLKSRNEPTTQRIKIFSGLKVISLIGLMLTNLGIIVYNTPTTSLDPESQQGYILISFYCVDIWLMISGFFISYLLLRQYSRMKSSKILLMKILRRFFRFWPIYIFSLFLNWKIIPLLGSGPLWPFLLDYPERWCDVSYYKYILMISNLMKGKCYNWLWLFEIDFQLCLITVPFLLFYIKFSSKTSRALFYFIQICLILSSVFLAYYIKTTKNIYDYYFHREYKGVNITPIARIGGYLIGYILGIQFYKFKKTEDKNKFWIIKLLNSKVKRKMISFLGLAGLVAILFLFRYYSQNQLNILSYFYFCSLRTIIPILIVLIILPSLFGYDSPIKKMMQSWICNLISKLSRSIYSLQFSIFIYMVYCRQFDLQLSNFTIIFLTCCGIIPSLICSIVLTTMIQIPIFLCKKVFSKTQKITYFEH